MVKIESNMLILDSTFTKDDVKAINDFILQAERRTEERIIKLLKSYEVEVVIPVDFAIALIRGEK